MERSMATAREEDRLVVDDPLEEIAAGNYVDRKYGVNIADAMNFNNISVEDALRIMRDPEPRSGGSRV
jgi:hypothetical protein